MTNQAFNPNYSVLMSVYKNDDPQYLDAAIGSMVCQTVPFHDMVIVCDGVLTESLDEILLAWVERIGRQLSIVRLAKNVGLGAALNVGLSQCKCDIVARMDADDISRPYRCETLLAAMDAEDLDLVGGAIEEFDSVPGDLGAVRRLPGQERMIKRFAARRNPFNHVSVVFRKHAVDEVGGYQPFYLMEDYWLWARMISAGCRCANVEDVVVDVRVGSGMYSRRSSISYLKSQYSFFFQIRKLGISNWNDVVITLCARTISTIIPVSGVKALYKRFLRG